MKNAEGSESPAPATGWIELDLSMIDGLGETLRLRARAARFTGSVVHVGPGVPA